MTRTSRAMTGPANPFGTHPLRRYAFAWQMLDGRQGRHLDIGIGAGDFLGVLHTDSPLACEGADPHPGYLAGLRARHPDLPLHALRVGKPLDLPGPYASGTLLDVLEHVPDENALLAELHRLIEPDGLLVVTVPRRHVFSFLDPDNAKFRFPRAHRFIYAKRFGKAVYRERFEDLSDDLRGDMSLGKDEHTNYRTGELLALLRANGFEPVVVTGANLFWRWLQIPALLTGGPLRRLLERGIHLDGKLFHSANLFVAARRLP